MRKAETKLPPKTKLHFNSIHTLHNGQGKQEQSTPTRQTPTQMRPIQERVEKKSKGNQTASNVCTSTVRLNAGSLVPRIQNFINNPKLVSQLLWLSRSHCQLNEALNSCLHQRQEKHNWLQTGIMQTA